MLSTVPSALFAHPARPPTVPRPADLTFRPRRGFTTDPLGAAGLER